MKEHMIDPQAAAPKMGRAAMASVLVALTLVVAKGAAWIFSGSVALLGSWIDSLLDLMASVVNLVAVRTAVAPPDKEHRFGHGKAEAIAGMFQSLAIMISAAYLFYASAGRLIDPQPVLNGGWAIGVSVLAILLTAGLVGFQKKVVRETGSIAIEADSLHYTGDLLLNLAVIAAIAVSSFAGITRADGLFGLGIAVYLAGSAWRISRSSIDMLMDREFPESEREAIFNLVMGNKNVLGLHDLKTRQSGLYSFIQMHIELEPELSLYDAHHIADEVEATVGENFPNAEIIIHTDPFGLEDPSHLEDQLD